MGGSAKPLELVQYDSSTGKFQVGKEALSVLRGVKGPVAVVAVCGRARQGKSYILNQLLGRSNGFQVAPSVRPCTKGLWMWSAPIKRTGTDGQPYHLVLLDTEGIDAFDQTGQYSTQVFSLAVLLSSMFVYNQMGGIDEAAIDRLSLVTEMTKHIRVRAHDGDANEHDLQQFTPSFLWLLRDFYLELTQEDGSEMSAREYLERALRNAPGASAAVASKNRIRDSIRALFPDRDCFTLVRPVSDERKLTKLEQMDTRDLRPEFLAGMEHLTQLIFDRARPKHVGNAAVSGGVLAGLTEAYVAAINDGAVPTIQSAWQSVAESECARALDAARAVYEGEFDKNTPPEDSALAREHARAVGRALAAFRAAAVGDQEVSARHEARLRALLDEGFEKSRETRVLQATLACQGVLDEGRRAVAEACARPDASYDGVLKALEAFARKYAAAAQGPRKHELLSQFLVRDVLAGPLAGLVRGQAAAAQKELAAATERAASEAAARKAADAEVARLSGEARSSGQRFDELSRQLQAERTQLARAEGELRALQQQIAEVRERAEERVREAHAAGEARQREIRAESASQIARLDAELAARGREVADLRARAAEAEAGMSQAAAEAVALRKSLASAEAAREGLAARLEAGGDDAARAQGRVRDAERRARDLELEVSVERQRADTAAARAETLEKDCKRIEKELSEARAAVRAGEAAAAARAGAVGAGNKRRRQHSPEPEITDGPSPPVAAPRRSLVPAAPVVSAQTRLTGDPTTMKISDLKSQLTEAGYADEVHELNLKKGKKADWVALYQKHT
ncbi:unnamed protein product [Pedinophyceae sp. YPF-701]|nr:unnamed protein product [Pedinophyceae sp. YPF-701]